MITQVFVPDPAAVGQYMADVAFGFAERGVPVRVLTADRGYDDPTVSYDRRETVDGVDILRLFLSSFGKRNLAVRVIGQLSFLAQSVLIGLTTRKIGSVFVTASPPVGSLAGLIVGVLRRVPITYWVMDINPDQAIVSGNVRSTSLFARVLSFVDIQLLSRARTVITLDRQMAVRLASKAELGNKLAVVPLWPLVERAGDSEINAFARAHNPDGRFVVMYSGNHSLVHPLGTLLEAAVRLKADPRVRFLFVGGGVGKREVAEVARKHGAGSVSSLPYQPFGDLGQSLAAADVHAVTMGDDMVGLVHPSKVYGALAVGRPVLYIGPDSHVSDLIREFGVGWHFSHGDVDGVTAQVIRLVEHAEDAADAGAKAARIMREHFPRVELRASIVGLALGSNGGKVRGQERSV